MATTKLDPVLREVAGLAVGVAVDNHYGVAFHSTMLASLGVDEADIEVMRHGGTPADPLPPPSTRSPARSPSVGARSLTHHAVVLEAGLSTEAILEVVLEGSFARMVGLIDNLAGQVELDGFLAQRAWR